MKANGLLSNGFTLFLLDELNGKHRKHQLNSISPMPENPTKTLAITRSKPRFCQIVISAGD